MAGTRLKTAVCMLVTLIFMSTAAEAAIRSVTVNTARDHDGAPGYTYAEITMHGSVARADGSVGHCSVPAVVIYPRHGRGNKPGVVDWLNSAFYHFFPATTEFGTFEFTRLATGSYLFDEGYTYISIQWNKKVTEIFGPTAPNDGQPHNHLVYGSIDRSADAWEILLDAARLLKDPSVYPGSDGPARVTTVVSSGYSQGGGAQLEFLAEELDPTRVYDGHLIQMIGSRASAKMSRALRLLSTMSAAADGETMRPSCSHRDRHVMIRRFSASGRARSSLAMRPT